MNKISYIILLGAFLLPQVSFAQVDGFDSEQKDRTYRLIKLQRELDGLSKKRAEVEETVRKVETAYDEMEAARLAAEQGLPTDETVLPTDEIIQPEAQAGAEDSKVKSTKKAAKTNTDSTEASDKDSTTSPAVEKDVVVPVIPTLPKPAAKKYNPTKTTPTNTRPGNSGGRRPFIRSEINNGQQIRFAGISGRDSVGFGAEGGNYSGFNDENVYVFPDPLAVNCELNANDAAKDGRMEKCLKSILVDMSNPNQDAKDYTKKMYNDGLVQEVTQAVVIGLQNKNIAANFETEVLDPLKEKTSKATTERGDFESITMTDMEAVKAKYRIIEVYSTMLKYQALKNFGDFELKNEGLTRLKEETEDK